MNTYFDLKSRVTSMEPNHRYPNRSQLFPFSSISHVLYIIDGLANISSPSIVLTLTSNTCWVDVHLEVIILKFIFQTDELKRFTTFARDSYNIITLFVAGPYAKMITVSLKDWNYFSYIVFQYGSDRPPFRHFEEYTTVLYLPIGVSIYIRHWWLQ